MDRPSDGHVPPVPGGTAEGGRKRRMTARWRYANRVNARASTGPKTAAGKAKVACNALRHGLSLPVLSNPALAPEVEDLARTIAQSVTGQALDGHRHDLACRIAEAVVDLRRVHLAKAPVLAELEADPKSAGKRLTELVRLDRYEARALSRRRIAIRAFAKEVMPLRIAKALRQNKAMEGKVKDSNAAGRSAQPAMTAAEQNQAAERNQSAGQSRSAEQSHSAKPEGFQ